MKRKIALFLGLCMMILTGCNFGKTYIRYDNSDKYLAGGEAELTQKVTNIEVSWISGRISVLGSEQNFVSFIETPKYDIEEKDTLHYLVENDTLHIECAAKGTHEIKYLEKDLTIRVPKNIQLNVFRLETASSSLSVANISANMDFDMVSGNLTINECTGSTLNINSVSGNIDVNDSNFKSIDVDAVSGKIEFDSLNVTNNLNIDVVSGNVYLKVGELTGFKVEFDSTSGELHSDLELKQNGNVSTYKDGSRDFEVETVSGNLYLI